VQGESRTWYRSLDRLQRGALAYSLVMFVVIVLLFISGAGSADGTNAPESLNETAALPPAASATATVREAETRVPTAPVIGTSASSLPPTNAPASPTAGATAAPAPTATVVSAPTVGIPTSPTASAPSVTLPQTADDFAQGTGRGVALGPDATLTLAPTISDDFQGSALDTATWQFVPWSPGGTASVRDDTVTVNVAAIRTARTFVHGTFEARVRFTAGPPPFENIAWSADLNGPTAIMIGEPVDDPGHLYARIKQAGQDDRRVRLPDTFDSYHVYRIAWGTTQVEFSVDGVPRATISATLDTPMRAWISAATAGHAPVVDWARVLVYDTPDGTFTSAKLDMGGDTVWRALRLDALTPPGTALVIRTRTSLDGRIWSAYEPVAADGGVVSPPGRYLQYELALSGTPTASPAIRSVIITHARRLGAVG